MADQVTSQLAKARIDEAGSSSSSGETSPTFDSANVSGISSPNSSRPPSPLLRPLGKAPAASTKGLPSRPKPGFNALNGASMGFTAMANSAAKKQENMSQPKSATVSAPSSKPTTPEESDDEEEDDIARRRAKPPARRTSSAAMAPFITKFDLYEPDEFVVKDGTRSPLRLEKVAIIGSGSWGTALARVAAINVAEREGFDSEVRMWVREREIPGKGKLTSIINETHQNERYLPNVELPENLIAVPELKDVVKNATLILFCVPHQFLPDVLKVLNQPGVVNKSARGISAIKGVDVQIKEETDPTGQVKKTAEIYTFPGVIEKGLNIPCSALGGANIALDVGRGEFCETTIGVPGPKDAALWHAVFDGPTFRVHPIEDVAGVSLSGALKNIVALAAGFVDGMGLGGNTKAAILRHGLLEMSSFTMEFFPSSSPLTFSHHSAGVADLITTSFGGRNRKCAEAFIKCRPEYGGEGIKSFVQLEEELLNGQKLQGTLTAEEVFHFLDVRGRLEGYPLFDTVYRIAFQGLDPKRLFDGL
ncbi:NAD-dependent glycerol-3-phosphate dehydrogenase [Cylindrobasidium torrendii FP15055 ss-10]|uniref:Glycerol-3-phosphate dehydrogenase [NAD(+)] n=1 Tax=Cylindrobasidium torrendii FP15055 ss-10 TaxID=1314674 RepID=A0A0D7ATN9_9AGAR|nr:NAD-dependent glycerol-3-phosphate dehydrogenase [Cylindrobasidium torrendii FP15055 ss-10]